MAGIQTSKITTAAADDLTIQPASGKKTLLKSVDSTNPGTTPISTLTDGEVKRLNVASLADIGTDADGDNDWLMIQDVSDGNKIKKIKAGEVLGGGGLPQIPLDPNLPSTGNWVDVDSVLAVKAGGNGSTNDLKNSVEFAVGNNTFNQNDKNVTIGQTFSARWIQSKLNSANHGQIISGTLYAKSGSDYTQTFNLTISKQPTSGWDLIDVTGQPTSTQIVSAASVPTGMNAPSPVTIDGGTLTGIEVSVNGGAFTSSPGKIENGQPIQVRGTTGASDSTAYTALVSIGGLQRTWTVTTGVSGTAGPIQPVITSPVNNAVGIGKHVTIAASPYFPNGSGSHLNSDWELKQGGTVVASSMADTVNKTSWTVPSAALSPNAVHTVRVRYRSSDPLESAWSPESSFTTDDLGAPPIGAPVEGGYFAGEISMTANNVATHLLIVSPKFDGLLTGEGPPAGPCMPFSTPRGASDGDPEAKDYGLPAALANVNNGSIKHSVYQWIWEDAKGPVAGTYDGNNTTGTGIGSYNDWYLPAQNELAILYFFLKPTTDANVSSGGKGKNENSVDPYTPNTSFGGSFPSPTDVP